MSKACRFSVVSPLAALLLALTLAGCAGDRDREGGGGACDPECGPFQACCTGADGASSCRPIGNDPNNCGGCGIVCSSGVCMSSMCVAGGDGGPGFDGGPTGMCSPTCSSSQRCCGTECVNRNVTTGTDGRSDSSFDNCPSCGIPCDPERASACSTPLGMSGTPKCMCGNFDQCPTTDVCVMGSGGTFQCVNLSTDKNNCGEVGNVCPGEEICSGGECVCGSTGAACGEGTTCCCGSCISTDEDPSNCGGCGVVCADEGGDSCVAGECKCGDGPACTAPSGTSLGELCCSGGCVTQDASNCGECGSACDGDSDCVYGTGFGGTTAMACCGVEFFGMAICSDFGGGGDGGIFPGLDAGI